MPEADCAFFERCSVLPSSFFRITGSEVIVTTEGGESDHTTEILVAVISSVSGGVILVFITKYCLKEGSAGQ